MSRPPRYSALMTDLYELTMLAGYFEKGMHEEQAVFDLFFRKIPFQGSYAIFAGLEPALDYLSRLRFTDDEIDYLASLDIFSRNFLDYLRDFRFRCKVTAPPEGTAVFNHEPLLSVEGNMAEAQLVETALLNIVNYQTLIATKAARIQNAAGDGTVVEFGLRRAHGPDGGLSEARAAAVGGVLDTSNTWAGQVYGLPVKGTHAHSWVMAYEDELSSFRDYADVFPDNAILLVDTYDTLKSGIPNAIKVARELRERGHEVKGVRLDSGDLAYLSRESRRMLDEAGFPDVKIVASGDLDEFVIDSIRREGGKIDIYGVGTKLATAAGEGGGHLGGVYKLVRFRGKPRLKITAEFAKATIPDRKRLLRGIGLDDSFLFDLLCREEEGSPEPGERIYDPTNPAQSLRIGEGVRLEEVRQVVMEEGKIVRDLPSLEESSERCRDQLRRLPEGSLRLTNPHRYKVSISQELHDLRSRLMEKYEGGKSD